MTPTCPRREAMKKAVAYRQPMLRVHADRYGLLSDVLRDHGADATLRRYASDSTIGPWTSYPELTRTVAVMIAVNAGLPVHLPMPPAPARKGPFRPQKARTDLEVHSDALYAALQATPDPADALAPAQADDPPFRPQLIGLLRDACALAERSQTVTRPTVADASAVFESYLTVAALQDYMQTKRTYAEMLERTQWALSTLVLNPPSAYATAVAWSLIPRGEHFPGAAYMPADDRDQTPKEAP